MSDDIAQAAYAKYERESYAKDAETLRGMARRLREGFYSDDYDAELAAAADVFEFVAADWVAPAHVAAGEAE